MKEKICYPTDLHMLHVARKKEVMHQQPLLSVAVLFSKKRKLKQKLLKLGGKLLSMKPELNT